MKYKTLAERELEMDVVHGRQKLEGEDYQRYYIRRWKEIHQEAIEQEEYPAPINFLVDKLIFTEWYALDLLDDISDTAPKESGE